MSLIAPWINCSWKTDNPTGNLEESFISNIIWTSVFGCKEHKINCKFQNQTNYYLSSIIKWYYPNESYLPLGQLFFNTWKYNQ